MRLSKLGLKIIEEANNLKRTKEALSEELNISKNALEKVLLGKCKPKEAQDLVNKMLKKYPISASKLKTSADEKFFPFSILDIASSKKSARVFKRKNNFGKTKDYYEYRDTAMQKNTPIYPEWIKPLVVVGDNKPQNKLICYNKGHLLHQFTFFIGEVNFYWKDEQGYHCKAMNTGDSNYIPPFIPHSFSSRNKSALGLIIAVTFADILSFSRKNLWNYKRKNIEKFSGNNNLKLSYFRLFIKDYLNKNFLDMNYLIEKMNLFGVNKNAANKIVQGKKKPSDLEFNALSKILSISTNELNYIIKNIPSEVVNKKLNEKKFKIINLNKDAFKVWDLAKSQYDELIKAFIMEVSSKTKNYDINHQMHEYVYNFGNKKIIVKVENKKYILEADESMIFSPMIKHSFYASPENKSTKILIVRVSEEFSQEFTKMYAGLSTSSRKRIFSAVSQWF